MTGPTPGPWLYRPRSIDDWGDVRAGEDGFIVALARDAGATDYKQKDEHRKNGTDPYEANGRLIAAAPELLDALSALADISRAYLAHMDADDIVALDKARAAIAKAGAA